MTIALMGLKVKVRGYWLGSQFKTWSVGGTLILIEDSILVDNSERCISVGPLICWTTLNNQRPSFNHTKCKFSCVNDLLMKCTFNVDNMAAAVVNIAVGIMEV